MSKLSPYAVLQLIIREVNERYDESGRYQTPSDPWMYVDPHCLTAFACHDPLWRMR